MNPSRFKKLFTYNSEKTHQLSPEPDSEKNDGIKNSKLKGKHKDSKNPSPLPTKDIKSELKIAELEATNRAKDIEIERLNQELEKMRSYLKGSVHTENYRFLSSKVPGVESTTEPLKIDRFPKDNATSRLILDSLKQNIYMQNLDQDQLAEIVSSMFSKPFKKGDYILKEGDAPEYLFLVDEGELELLKEDEVIGNLGPGKAFGEHSFMFGFSRTTTVIALSDGKLWSISKQTFENILMKTMMNRQKTYLELLNKVPLFYQIPDYNLCKIVDIMREVRYLPNQDIYHQGNKGETLYIVKQGTVEFHKKNANQTKPAILRVLNQGSFFGEKSLLGEEWYHNDAVAGQKGCALLQIERHAFSTFIGSISYLRNDFMGDELKCQQSQTSPAVDNVSMTTENQLSQNSYSGLMDNISRGLTVSRGESFRRLTLDELHTVTTLGAGNFSRIELVVPKNDPRISYALKQMKKKNIVINSLQAYILNEKRLLQDMSCNFVIKMFKTFRDRKYVYMLMEACLGGDMSKMIRDRRCLSDKEAQFFIACIIEALRYLHKMYIMFRDLKPSNILIDDRGYCKLTNFVYAKKLGVGKGTYTFCGTPEYVAPEVILKKRYDLAIDYWGLGIIMYEMLVGHPPFSGGDPMKTYNVIMKGFTSDDDIPHNVGRNAKGLIRKLCRQNPDDRIGYVKNNLGEVQKHKWFEKFNWVELRNMLMKAPITPKIKDTTDNEDEEDEFPPDEEIPPDETSNWDKDY